MSDPRRVSVIVCAYSARRWDHTVAALASAWHQVPAPDEVILVIDHNESLRGRFEGAGLGASVVANREARGLSGARNTGVATSTGDVIAFLDDDAEAAPGWLAALVAPFDDPAVVAVGARITPVWPATRPRWMPTELDWVVGCSYSGLPLVRADVRNVLGAAMAFRRTAIEDAGGFNPSVGRGTGLPLGGEETELCLRIRRLRPGSRVVYEPRSLAWHHVDPARTTPRYVLLRAWAEGITKARVAALAGRQAGLETERRYVARVLPGAVRANVVHGLRSLDGAALGRAGLILAAVAAAGTAYVGELLWAAARRLAGRRAPGGDHRELGHRDAGHDARSGRLRILQVTPRYTPLVGGVETHTFEVARRLAARGHRVVVATTDPDRTLPDVEHRDGVEVRRVPAWPRGRDWYFAPGLLSLVGRRRWDVVHVQGVHTLVPPVAMLGAIVSRRRFVLTFHSGGHSSPVRTAARGLQWRLLGPLLRRATLLIGVSRFERDRFADALGLPRDRLALIPNGTEARVAGAAAGSGDPAPDAAPDDAAPAAPSRPQIVSLGRLERYKGHQRVIAAMPGVLERIPGARLRIAGTGPYGPQLAGLVDKLGLGASVTIAPIPRDEVGAALVRADLVVLMSDYEAHPVAVMEAVGAGCRVLVADTSGLRELAEAGLVRAIPAASEPAAVADAILGELAAPRPAVALDLPTWDDTADALEAVYRKVAGAR